MIRPRLKILYVAPMGEADTCTHRYWALQRLGQVVVPFDNREYSSAGGKIISKLRYHFPCKPLVRRFNRDLLDEAIKNKVDLVWCDKQLMLHPDTLKALNSNEILSVNYCIDNPFGTSGHGGWRLLLKSIPEYTLHVVQRTSNISEYHERGARNVVKIQTAFEPTVHFPPSTNWSDLDRNREVSFIGSPYDNRSEFLSKLWREFDIPLNISGGGAWRRLLPADAASATYIGGELHQEKYREGIWKSKINLSFITHCNLDEYTQKSFEIAGCGAFLLAERSPGHMERFKENEEAVFFSSVQECAEKIRQYLPDEPARTRIAEAGQRRAVKSGYDNDTQMGIILDMLIKLKEFPDEVHSSKRQ